MHPSSSPIVSLIFSGYPKDADLSGCLRQLHALSFQDWEALFIGEDLLPPAKDDRLRSCASVAEAKGAYVLFCDPSESLASDALELLYKRAEDQKADIVIGDSTRSAKRPMRAAALASLFYLRQSAAFPYQIADLAAQQIPFFYGNDLFASLSGKLIRTAFLQGLPELCRAENPFQVRALCLVAQRVSFVPMMVLEAPRNPIRSNDALLLSDLKDAQRFLKAVENKSCPEPLIRSFLLRCLIYRLMYAVPMRQWSAVVGSVLPFFEMDKTALLSTPSDAADLDGLRQGGIGFFLRLAWRMLRERVAMNVQVQDTRRFFRLLLKNSCVLPNPFPDK